MRAAHIIIAALLCAHPASVPAAPRPVPKSIWSDVCLERDSPNACARAERRAERIAFKVCGPEGAVDWDNYPDPPACNRSGWDGRRYGAGR